MTIRTTPPMLTVDETAALLRPRLPSAQLQGDGSVAYTRVHSDTRSLQPGDLFVALQGERFDAHDFMSQARAAGAVAALAQRGFAEAGLPGVQVDDTRRALGELAAAWRARMVLPLIAVTGSNGKTTVTQMIASILRAWVGAAAFSTIGNLNNDIGVPLTLLRLRQGEAEWHRAGVVELGMNHVGEIAYLAKLVAPTVALVNNAQREHQEFMATVEAVARENGAVIEALGEAGVAVFPAGDEYAPLWRTLAGARRTLTFALDDAPGAAEATVRGRVLAQVAGLWLALDTPAGDATLRLRMAGLHNARNALAAASCAIAAGCPLQAVVQGLESFEPVKGRSQLKSLVWRGVPLTLIDDTYNANPDSVRAAIDVLAGLPGPRWLVLGDMGEVGAQGPAFHAEVGAYARARGIDALWTAGAQSEHAAQAFGAARHFDTTPALAQALAAAPADAPACASLVVKGSRFMKMEQVVAAILAQSTQAAEAAAVGSTDAA